MSNKSQNNFDHTNSIKNNTLYDVEINKDLALLKSDEDAKIIEKYLNITTPYKGILLFHGSGSGMTPSCFLTNKLIS